MGVDSEFDLAKSCEVAVGVVYVFDWISRAPAGLSELESAGAIQYTESFIADLTRCQ